MSYAKLNIHVFLEFSISERPVAVSIDLLNLLLGEEIIMCGTMKNQHLFQNEFSKNIAPLKGAANEFRRCRVVRLAKTTQILINARWGDKGIVTSKGMS